MSVPTAATACSYLALGDVPVTPAAASSMVHSIVVVEYLKSSPGKPAYQPARDVRPRSERAAAIAARHTGQAVRQRCRLSSRPGAVGFGAPLAFLALFSLSLSSLGLLFVVRCDLCWRRGREIRSEKITDHSKSLQIKCRDKTTSIKARSSFYLIFNI